MNTQLLSADHPNAIPLAAEVVRAGGLVVFPTDTLYGVGCDPCQPAALQKIYAAKGRSAAKASGGEGPRRAAPGASLTRRAFRRSCGGG